MKLACLFDLFELPDCAAELLVNRGAFLDPPLRDELLDTLVTGERGAYAAHVASFERDFTALFPSRRPRLNGGTAEVRTRRLHRLEDRVSALREKNAALCEKNAALRERLKARRDRIAQLTKRIERLEKR
jgi:hypothetical protein